MPLLFCQYICLDILQMWEDFPGSPVIAMFSVCRPSEEPVCDEVRLMRKIFAKEVGVVVVKFHNMESKVYMVIDQNSK